MGYLCGSAVVKFKTYQMTNGREIIMNRILRLASKRNTNDGKICRRNVKMASVDVKIGSAIVNGNVARFIVNK